MTQPAFDTDEQLSGRAADAVADMHDELSRRYSELNIAEAQLAEVLLSARATSEAGQRRLQQIQHQVVEAIANPVNALDTPTGERQFLAFLRRKIAEIQRVVDDGAVTANDQAEITRALANGYLVDPVPSAPVPSRTAIAAPQQPAASASPSAMPSLLPALGGLPPSAMGMPSSAAGLGQASPPLGWLSSLLDKPDSVRHDETDRDENPEKDDRAAERPDADPQEIPDDAPPDEDGPAQTRPDGN